MNHEVSVFISYKRVDEEVAMCFKESLELLGGGKVKCFVSRNIAPGDNWYNEIKANIIDSNVLLLIYTSSNTDWSWPLYEAGLATDVKDEDFTQVICIHHPDEKDPPGPLKFDQMVSGDEEGVKFFLKEFFTNPKLANLTEPINPMLDPDSEVCESVIKNITSMFSRLNPWDDYYTHVIRLKLHSFPLKEKHIPLDSVILGGEKALKLFGLGKHPPKSKHWTWAELLDKTHSHDAVWVQELNEKCYQASNKDYLESMKSAIEFDIEGDKFMPYLHKAEANADGTMVIEIVFFQLVHSDHLNVVNLVESAERDNASPTSL